MTVQFAMNQDFKLLFLGTGTSTGIPMIGCDCPVCKSTDPRNRRLRSSVYITAGDLRILVDTSPDFREQALRHDIRHIDAVLITHAHVDHLFGLDDIRRINTIQGGKTMPLYASERAIADINRIFEYIFKPNVPGTYRPKLELRPCETPFEIPQPEENGPSLKITPFPIIHGWSTMQGFRFDYNGRSIAYIPDCNEFPKESADIAHGVDVMIIDTLRYRPHPTHLTVEQSLATIATIAPKRAFLTHIGHDLDHEKLTNELKSAGRSNILPAYDGLEIELQD